MSVDIQSLHRASRLVLDSTGEQDVGRGAAKLKALSFQIVVGASVAESPALQTAVLTAVNAGHRTFRGGVEVIGASGLRTQTPLAGELDLGLAVVASGGRLAMAPRPEVPTLVVGVDALWPRTVPVALRLQVEEWKAAVSPADEVCLNDASRIGPAGIFAASLGVSELLGAALDLHPEAGSRTLGLSLWRPDEVETWRRAPAGPAPRFLPASLWLIGLGHLGQAYAWSLASLGYPAPNTVEILLQDDECVAPENLSTCLLSTMNAVTHPKTRTVARWLEARGFRTRIVERRFRSIDRFAIDDPTVALLGIDSSDARADIASALQGEPYTQVLDMGLGPNSIDFDEMVLHASPFSGVDIDRWRAASDREKVRVATAASSDKLREIRDVNGLDECGIIQLAGQAVGVPYVGAAAGALLVSELLRRLAGASPTRAMALRLRDLHRRFPPTTHSISASRLDFVTAE